MRSKDLAKASGLAVAFDHTAPTFYRVSQNCLRENKNKFCNSLSLNSKP